MKKIIIGMMTICLAGCSSQAAATTEPAATASPESESIWNHDPDLDFNKVSELKSFNYLILPVTSASFGQITLYIQAEKTGYLADWYQNGYNEDAILVENNSKQGIYTNEGEQLYEASIDKVSTPFLQGVVAGLLKGTDNTYKVAYGYANTSTSKAQIFDPDFKSMTEVSLDNFNYTFSPSSQDPYLAIQSGVLGIAGMTRSSSGSMTGWSFEPYIPADVKENMIIPVIDSSFSTTGYQIVGPDGSPIVDITTRMNYRAGSYVNNFYVISDGTYTSVVDAGSGQDIATQYQEAKYFEDGYLPIKKSGKWGYIDTTGKEVTDFIFDDACASYHGYAWVKYNGKYGVINLKDVLADKEKQVNAYWCAPSSEDAIGKLTVKVSNLLIRSGAGTDNTQIGVSIEGSVYPVFETKKDTDYTWYRINENEWVASEGTWAVYEAAK